MFRIDNADFFVELIAVLQEIVNIKGVIILTSVSTQAPMPINRTAKLDARNSLPTVLRDNSLSVTEGFHANSQNVFLRATLCHFCDYGDTIRVLKLIALLLKCTPKSLKIHRVPKTSTFYFWNSCVKN